MRRLRKHILKDPNEESRSDGSGWAHFVRLSNLHLMLLCTTEAFSLSITERTSDGDCPAASTYKWRITRNMSFPLNEWKMSPNDWLQMAQSVTSRPVSSEELRTSPEGPTASKQMITAKKNYSSGLQEEKTPRLPWFRRTVGSVQHL